MNNKSIFKSLLLLFASIFLLISCERDLNEIGAQVLSDELLGLNKYDDATVVAFNQPTGIVQTSNLPLNILGVYDNPVFGKTRANFVTEVELSTTEPDFSKVTVLDSVVLQVPYFSTKTKEATSTSPAEYRLDSISGDKTKSINLKIFESGFELIDLDPNENFEKQQKYYSNEDAKFDNAKIGLPLNNASDVKENAGFIPEAFEYKIFPRDAANTANPMALTKTTNPTRFSPRMNIHLDAQYFYNKIIKADKSFLSNNNKFKEYFKGLYFQVADAPDGHLMKLNFKQGFITLYYTADDTSVPGKKIIKSFVLNLTGKTVNLIQQNNSDSYTNGLATINSSTGDEKLYLKGGTLGSVTFIDLFKNNELTEIKAKGWLINEANLTFYIDNVAMTGAPEPQRVYLYDVKNNRQIIDYQIDQTTAVNPKYNKSIHGGIIQKDPTKDGRGIKYKLRITDHIKNLINTTAENVRLGLAVTESILELRSVELQNPIKGVFERLPAASVMNPFGTILFGNNIPSGDVNYDKRLKLEIYYTKPKN